MTTIQSPDDVLDVESEDTSAYQTIYTMSFIEREANEAYNAEELSLEVV